MVRGRKGALCGSGSESNQILLEQAACRPLSQTLDEIDNVTWGLENVGRGRAQLFCARSSVVHIKKATFIL